jgi:hypothetical protein
MQINCPSCRSKIATDDINVTTDVALCRACGNTFHLSEVLGGSSRILSSLLSSIAPPPGPVDLNSPPSGAWYEPLPDGFTAGATTRTWGALFIVPFTCIWSGGSMFGIYGTQIIKGHFNLASSLFGIPFLLGSIFLVSWCTMSVAGKVSVTRHADQLTVFTGVGPIGWSRTCNFSDFNSASEDFSFNSSNSWNRQGKVIRLEGKTAIAFGSMLTTERRYFLLAAIRTALSGSSPSPVFAAPVSRFR